ncbi:efflux RND transporter periplasmic adaptor subunit [Flavobacterium aquidurense]|uniref:Cu(I)/Ag(I) efflux system membrane fusion protein n=2 Tax=Flavobacterium TaxID=237 RepID=A0A7W7IW81_9FLAO|nr:MULTISPECIES: efflux RND transporter periplasmic adaptor subunit [Flavobacterium]MBB4801729.1 Cu(I)/Ag(I) efflux system membrane fusion protein [Flavobacterium nitrogenifigens]MBB6386687.1 Cu(I)/Ag(I) efflux system membrane fusion protein [Flavobacterium notoginsengisoli]
MRKFKSLHLISYGSLIAIGLSTLLLTSCTDQKKEHKESNLKTENSHEQHADHGEEDVYTCPMHPHVHEHKGGSCPICGMPLVKKGKGSATVKDVDLATLLKPTNDYVVSQVPVTNVSTADQEVTLESLGRIDYDTRLNNTISSKIAGRIEKLYVKYRYQHIHKGMPVMDIYSPELVTAEQEYLFLIKSDPENSALIKVAQNKLMLLGMTQSQINDLVRKGKPSYVVTVYSNYSGHVHEAGNMGGSNSNAMGQSGMSEELPIKEGMYVQRGQTVFQLFNTDRSWVLLNFFAEQASLIKKGMPIKVVAETAPDRSFQAKIDFIEPFYRQNSKTLSARAFFNNSELKIPIGSQVKASLNVTLTGKRWLPETAVISLGLRHVVFLKQGGGFQVKQVQTGVTINGKVEILSGLESDDNVAINAQYLIDSESFIKTEN